MHAIHATADTHDTFATNDGATTREFAADPGLVRGTVYGLVFVMPFWLAVIAIVSTH